jgi:hypothetical protein
LAALASVIKTQQGIAGSPKKAGGESWAYHSMKQSLWFALALILLLIPTLSPAVAAIIVVCGPPAPDGKECCSVMRQIYWKDYGQPLRPQAPDRADRGKLRAWYNKNCVGPGRPPLPAEP